MSVPNVAVQNWTQYNFEDGDTNEVITKQNGFNDSLALFQTSINNMIAALNDDVVFVNQAREELNADNIVHAPGSGLPNQAGSAYSKDVTTSATDTTEERLLKVGDGGVLGGDAPSSGNASAVRNGGFYEVDINAIGFPHASSLLFAARRTASLGVNRVAEIFIAANGPEPVPKIAFRGGDPAVLKFTDIYHNKNIVGIVSQEGGVPTGAIFQKDSNSFGSWEKHADGTLKMHVNAAFAGVSITNSDGGWFRSNDNQIILPLGTSEFIGPGTTFSISLQSGAGEMLACTIGRTRRSGSSLFFTLLKGVSTPSVDFEVTATVHSRWY
ncbi:MULTISPECIES: hypothetical protein [unclassified Halomonas]|uniref:hypothetical protein n=1 Tax=unclassified Halomonas TaxID=2609666 RepID=UPI001EF4C3DF|nr:MULTISPECIES: hypothetical protein [unclassified Halomonas]MCG7589667.1 hypothetical protein [Halomonas sp. McD50-5]MCG7616284.1 hypothetical protein [Halomonas sp. McD50-4]